MPNPFFSFKQFTVHHDLCAMKVGTDGVLLGAWADCSGAARILDVGTGSGLIALMLAQRSQAQIDAIDIDFNAYTQAGINFRNSKFKDQMSAWHSDFLVYHKTYKYDLIVSNPPYFLDSLPSPDKSRTTARHSKSLDFDSLITTAKDLLSDTGKISLILPAQSFSFIQQIAEKNHLFLIRKTNVIPLEARPPKRVLIEYSKEDSVRQEDELVIEISRHNYSTAYRELTKDFYL
ncbi:MAG: methyltransferase [Bacteroidales bacterium]|nr:methyltransferase [Bacteroidales bacterium]